MKFGEYEVPDDWESMSCIYNCGYVLVWRRGGGHDSGLQMDSHIYLEHERPMPNLWDWFRFRRRER